MELALCSSSSVFSIKHQGWFRTARKNVKRYYTVKHSPGNGITAAGRPSSPTTRMVSNSPVSGERGSSLRFRDTKIYRRQDSCLIMAPPKGIIPRAIVKFLGGAFIGAVPEVTYGYFVLNTTAYFNRFIWCVCDIFGFVCELQLPNGAIGGGRVCCCFSALQCDF